ncbi:MAG: penicillin-binding transpeptidase domain-containing protein, partial [bacterium]
MSENQITRKQKIRKFGQNRPAILSIIMALMTVIVVGRLYYLQIVRGDEFLAEFQSSIRREIAVPAERGRIFDRNGKLLAYNETAYNIVIRDETTQEDDTNALLNETIRNTILTVEKYGDTMTGDFGISLTPSGSYRFVDEGILQQRFLADVYGHAYIEDLTSDERTRTAEGVIEDLAARYKIDTSHAYYTGGYSGKLHLLDTVICRYLIALNYYQKYIPAVIAADVSPETVQEIRKMSDSLSGVSVEETLKRIYTQGETMSNVLGYTGEISAAELEEKSAEGADYRSGDIIGKLGIEASMEEELHGVSGRRTINVDSLGRELGLINETRSTSGSDVYLTIDSELQTAAYRILETSLTNIILDRIRDRVEDFVIDDDTSASQIIIPISDVYAACFENILDLDRFDAEDATETEKQVNQIFRLYLDGVIMGLKNEIEFTRTPYADLSNEYKSYENYMVTYLYNNGVLVRDNIDKSDSVYTAWTVDETASLSEFLAHAVSAGWIDASYLNAESSSDSDVYQALCDYVLESAGSSNGLARRIYRYMIINEALDPKLVCQLLLDQEIVSLPETELETFQSGRESAYTFMINRIRTMQLTPAMLALDPCTASCVLTDPRNGQVLALVSYPGYDNNLLSNGVDQDYFKKISQDASNPMLDYATQQTTAPGSTFKIVSSTAGLEEGVITLRDRLSCGRGFTKIGKGVGNEEDPSPVCWVYPSSHGSLALSG